MKQEHFFSYLNSNRFSTIVRMHYGFGVKYFYERYNCLEIMKKFICLTDERHPELPLQDDLNFIWLVE